jgi:ribosomal protein L7/L12
MHDTPDEERPLPAAAAAALAGGQMIDAIKQLRLAEGIGLQEAKQRVEAHVRRDPVLKAQYEERQAQTKRKLTQWFLIIDILLIAVAIWYFFGR